MMIQTPAMAAGRRVVVEFGVGANGPMQCCVLSVQRGICQNLLAQRQRCVALAAPVHGPYNPFEFKMIFVDVQHHSNQVEKAGTSNPFATKNEAMNRMSAAFASSPMEV